MARHRVGNSYLSDKELAEHTDSNWIGGLFILGAIIGGATIYSLTKSFGWPKWIVFSCVIIAGVGSGAILSALHRYVRMGLAVGFVLGLLYLLGLLVWNML